MKTSRELMSYTLVFTLASTSFHWFPSIFHWFPLVSNGF